MGRFGILVVLVGALLTGGSAKADDAVAKAFFEKGTKLYNLGEYGKALELFKSAYLEKPDAAFLFNIAQCQRQMSDFAAAEKSYRAYLREANPPPQQREAVQRLVDSMEQAAKEARQKQPPTGVQPPTPPPATVAPATPPPVSPKVAVPSPDDSAKRARSERWAGVGLIAAGAALAAAGGGGFYSAARSQNDGAGSGGVFHPDALSRRNTFEGLEAASIAVGGAAVVTGVVLYVVGRRSAPSSYALAPAVGAGHVGASFGFRY